MRWTGEPKFTAVMDRNSARSLATRTMYITGCVTRRESAPRQFEARSEELGLTFPEGARHFLSPEFQSSVESRKPPHEYPRTSLHVLAVPTSGGVASPRLKFNLSKVENIYSPSAQNSLAREIFHFARSQDKDKKLHNIPDTLLVAFAFETNSRNCKTLAPKRKKVRSKD